MLPAKKAGSIFKWNAKSGTGKFQILFQCGIRPGRPRPADAISRSGTESLCRPLSRRLSRRWVRGIIKMAKTTANAIHSRFRFIRALPFSYDPFTFRIP